MRVSKRLAALGVGLAMVAGVASAQRGPVVWVSMSDEKIVPCPPEDFEACARGAGVNPEMSYTPVIRTISSADERLCTKAGECFNPQPGDTVILVLPDTTPPPQPEES